VVTDPISPTYRSLFGFSFLSGACVRETGRGVSSVCLGVLSAAGSGDDPDDGDLLFEVPVVDLHDQAGMPDPLALLRALLTGQAA